MSKEKKSCFLINIEYYAVLAAVKTARIIPLRLAFILGQGIFLLYFHLSRRHKKRTIAHILHAGMAEDRTAAFRLARRNFMEFGKMAVEIIRTDDLVNKDNINSRVELVGDPEVIERLKKEPGIIVSAHLGNWEFAGLSYSLVSGIPLISIMRHMANPKLEKFFYRRIEYNRLKKGAMKEMLKALKDNKSVALTADQHANSKEGIETVFFGHPARTHFSPALIHLKTGKPIFVIVFRRTKKFLHYEARIKGVIDREAPSGDQRADLKKVVQKYTDLIEELVRETPEQWLWAHRRWLDINR